MTDNKYKLIILGVFLFSFFLIGFAREKEDKGDKSSINKTSKILAGDAYRLRVNKLDMGINNRGVMANVDIDGLEGGFFDGKSFLFSGGFFLTGYANGVLFGNAVASASRIEDYVPGAVGGTSDSRVIYILKSSDEPFSESWQEWKKAVESGAYFYDGDNDGVYNPVDKNGDGLWNPESIPGAGDGEDRPDLLGDETVWCVYNDGLIGADRASGFRENDPLGIEVRQTVWGYATAGDLGNIIFLRYSLLNTGTVAETLDSVFLGVWADPDLGEYSDDLVGCDTTLDAGYVYNDGDDAQFGANPPTFLIDFFQGPWEFTGNDADTAYNKRGIAIGIDTIVGARNLPLTSFVHYIQGDPDQGDPDNTQQARNYTVGKNQAGNVVDPCDWIWGDVFNENCAQVDGTFMYSGDPVTMQGWINTGPTDQRQMSNTGPFTLKKDVPVDIVVAYVVGRGTSALNSVSEAKRIDQAAQFVYNNNFQTANPPPLVAPTIKTSDNSIELIWETSRQVNFVDDAFDEGGNRVYNMRFEGFEVYMYNSNSTSEQEEGVQNAELIARYDIANNIKSVVVENEKTKERFTRFEEGIQLDPEIYGNPETGRIRLVMNTDPFTGAPLVKGRQYFISIIGYALNQDVVTVLDEENGIVLLPGQAFVQYTANKALIINGGIVPGNNLNLPFRSDVEGDHVIGASDATVAYSVINRNEVTDNEYQVSFIKDSLSSNYNLFYNITNFTNGTVIKDSLSSYNDVGVNNVFDGVSLNVEWIDPALNGLEFEDGLGDWFSSDTVLNEIGTFYMGGDFTEANGKPFPIHTVGSSITELSDMRRVELRFGSTSKAYRYVRGATIRYTYPDPDTTVSFADVPFQAWVVDEKFNEEYQLAVGFTESINGTDSLRNSDAMWDPNTDVTKSKEYIVIFNSPYSPAENLVYTGTGTGTLAGMWADVRNGYNIDASYPGVTPEMQKIAKSSWFDALYVVGLNRLNNSQPFSPSGTLVIEPTKYPLTAEDVYRYKVSKDLTSEEEQSLFDKVNVFPNPLFAFNPGASYTGQAFDEPYVTFSNLPNQVTVKIYTLSGTLLRILEKNDATPFLTWNLKNEDDLRVASGMYIAIVSNPELGDKVLKFAIIMPQKQILRY